MKGLKHHLAETFHSARSASQWGVTVGNTAFLASTAIGLSVVDPGGFKTYHLGRFWSQLNLRLLLSHLTVVGDEHVEPGRPYVAMVNHQSHVDIWAVYAALPLSIRWVMKQELRSIPIFGYCCDRMGHLYVKRGSTESAQRSLARAAESIASGTTVVFFPEGTRTEDGQLKPFKTGGFRLAMQAEVPVLPVSIVGTRDILPAGDWRCRTADIKVAIGEPIATTGRGHERADLNALMDETRVAIEAGLERARALP